MDRLRAHTLISNLFWWSAFFVRDCQRAKAEDRSRRTDDAIEARLSDLFEITAHLFIEMFDETTFVMRGQRIGFYKPFREPDNAGFEALPEAELSCRSQCDFDAAAADVDGDSRAATHIDTVCSRQMDESCLLSTGDHTDSDPRLPPHFGNKIPAVFGLTGGTSRRCHDFVYFVRFCEPLEFRQCLQGRAHCRIGQLSTVQTSCPKANHILLAVNNFEGKVWTDLHHDHVDGICPDIYRCNTHEDRVGSSAGLALACYTADIYLRTRRQTKGATGGDPTMNTRAPRVTTVLLQRLSRALKRHLPAAVAGNDLGVHQARVTSRRLREAVPVFATGLTGSKAGKARRKIRRLTRALGSVRELDVTVQLLDELARSPLVSRDAVEDVRARVMKERDAKRKTMIERLEDVNIEKLDRRLASVSAALNEASAEPWRKALATRLLRRSRRLTAAMNEAGQMYAPERLHAVRIAAKKLRYALELAADSGVKQAAPHVRTIKRAQDMLGKLHDWQVLETHVAAVQAEPRAGRSQSRAALENLARQIEDQCRHLHGRYVASAGALREAALAVRKVIVPLVAHPSRRTRSIKMTLSRPADTRAAAGDR